MESSDLATSGYVQGPLVKSGHRHHRSPSVGYFVHKYKVSKILLGVFTLGLLICVDLEQVSCIRAVQDVRTHLPVLGAVLNVRGPRSVKDVFLLKKRLPRNSVRLRNFGTGAQCAAAPRHKEEPVCRVESWWEARDGMLFPDWRSGRLLSAEDGSSSCLARKDIDRECSNEALKQCPSPQVSQDLMQDAGGGGDCMFLSIAAALSEVWTHHHTLRKDAGDLRRIAAVGIVGSRALLGGPGPATTQEKNVFMERLNVLAALEAGGSWEDAFSPTDILTKDTYTTVVGRKIGTGTIEGKAVALYSELSRSGMTHWGMAMDLEAIEDALNVGFIVFHENGLLYPLAARRDKRKKAYVLLYYRPGHFQQAAVGTTQANARSGLLPEELPDFLHAVHLVDCRTPVFPIPNHPLQAAT